MKNVILCGILLGMFIFSGCVMRTYTTEMERVDQEIYGNRGIIMGTPPPVEENQEVKKTRTIYNVEVELPSAYRPSSNKTVKSADKDKELYGNRGYIKGDRAPEKEVYVPDSGRQEQASDIRIDKNIGAGRMPQIVYREASDSSSAGINASASRGSGASAKKEYYVVQKGDTLQKISQEFFGTTLKWKDIFNANEHVLKSPDRIRPGQKLLIPKE